MSQRFKRQSWWIERLGKSWRRPRGKQNKMRQEIKGHGPLPAVGYRTPRALRGLHPSGLREVMVHNVSDVSRADTKTDAVRIAAGVGRKKRLDIIKACESLKVRVLNPGRAVEAKKK